MDHTLHTANLLARTAASANLLDAVNDIADVAEAVYDRRVSHDQPYATAVIQQLVVLLDACAATCPSAVRAAALTDEAEHLRAIGRRLRRLANPST